MLAKFLLHELEMHGECFVDDIVFVEFVIVVVRRLLVLIPVPVAVITLVVI